VNVSVAVEPRLVLYRADPPRYPRNAARAQAPEYATGRSASSIDWSRNAAVTDEAATPDEPETFNRYT
jgi:hypothetical protein